MPSRTEFDRLIARALRELALGQESEGSSSLSCAMDRRQFVRTAGGVLVAVSWGDACEEAAVGTLNLVVTGLGSGLLTGGSVSAASNTPGVPTVTVEVPPNGMGSVSKIPAATYQVTYTPPPGYVLVSGSASTKTVSLSAGGNVTLAWQVGAAGSGTGTVTINVYGLGASVPNGGSATVTRTDVPGTPITVPIPTTGTASASGLAPGTYSIQFTPPSGYTLASGTVDPQSVTLAAGQTQPVTFQVTGGSSAWSFGNIYEFGFEDGTKGLIQNYSGGTGDGTVISTDAARGTRCLSCTRTISTAGDDTPGPSYQDAYIFSPVRMDAWVRWALKSTPVWSPGIQKLFRARAPGFGNQWGTLDASGGVFSWYWDLLAGSLPATNLDGVQNAPFPAVPSPASIQDQWHWWEIHMTTAIGSKAHATIFFDDTKVMDQDSGLVNPGPGWEFGIWLIGGTVNKLTSGGPVTFTTRFDQIGVSSVQMHIPQSSSNP